MAGFSVALKAALKIGVQRLGILGWAIRVRTAVTVWPWCGVQRFAATLDGVTVLFSTEDDYSKSWFFPRYAGGRLHERVVTELLVDAVRSARCFIDVGAHLGWYTCIAAKHMPSGSVHGFEMDDMAFSLLERNIAINGCSNAHVYNVAVSDSPGTVSYVRVAQRPSPGLHIKIAGDPREPTTGKSVVARAVTLDEFLASRELGPDVIKVDVEGAEMKVLTGMKQTLGKHSPVLFLEIHPRSLLSYGNSVSAILAFLTDHSYQVYEICDMRTQESGSNLRRVGSDTILTENTMLYAKPATND